MLHFLPPVVRGAIAALLLGINTLVWCSLLFVIALIKIVLPLAAVRRVIDRILNAVATAWIACNSGWMHLTQRTQWDVAGIDDLDYRGWYMVNCNHQSWVDILVLQHLLNRRIPLLKFFLKQQLIYVPVIGLAWWALDFPFMRRHSETYLQAHPEKRHEDLEASRKACRKFALVPTSVMNFAEGTRFTPAKHRKQRSPYRHLLKPKAGALALALSVLGDRFRSFLDLTIVYPGGRRRSGISFAVRCPGSSSARRKSRFRRNSAAATIRVIPSSARPCSVGCRIFTSRRTGRSPPCGPPLPRRAATLPRD